MRAFSGLLVSLLTASDGTEVLPNSCEHLNDGFHWLKLLDGDDFPAVYQRCSNGYAILDYSVDSNIESYFTSWSEWHHGTYGPSNDFPLNWQDWFLPDTTYNPNSPLSPSFDDSFFQRPDSSDLVTLTDSVDNSAFDAPVSKSYNYLISPDCSVCDVDSPRQLFGTQTTYWMTGTLFGCFWAVKGEHNCDVDWQSDTCYTCAPAGSSAASDDASDAFDASDASSDVSDDASGAGGPTLVNLGDSRVEIGDTSTLDQLDKTGICPHNVRNSNHYVPLTHDQCAHDEAGRMHLKPSLGGKGTKCVCVQPKAGHDSYFEVEELPNAPEAPEAREELDIEESGAERNNIEDEASMDVFEVYQKDFEKGTFRIKNSNSGMYVIMEDIVFDFGKDKSYAYWPDTDDSEEYPGAGGSRDAFFLGYFAGITVECDNVILELNGHTLQMSEAFYYQQRWFSTIELASQSFLPGQGIGNFGADPKTACNVIVRNGVLGLSSHHGIHGNYNENIQLLNLHIRDFETHGIQFNGFNQILLKSLEIGPTSTRAHFTGEYGHMRAMLPRLKALSSHLDSFQTLSEQEIHFYGREGPTTMTAIAEEVERQLDMAYEYVAHGKTYAPDTTDPDVYKSFQSAMDVFINPSSLPNGGAMYGIFLNTFGASVFSYNLYTGFYSTGAHLEDIYIHDMRHEMKEYVRVFRPNSGDIMLNPFNAPLSAEVMFEDLEDQEKGWKYKGNIVTDAYIALNHLTDNWGYLGMQVLMNSYLTPWALGDENHAISGGTVAFGCNSDVMIHSGKGINGLRLDGVEDVFVKNLKVEELWDHTPLGNEKCGAYDDLACATCNQNGGHFRQTLPMQIGFSGNMNQGVNINAAVNVVLEDVHVSGIYSDTGPSFGVSIWPACDVELKGSISVEGLESGRKIEKRTLDYSDRPNKAPETCGVRVYWEYGDYSTSVNYEDADISTNCLRGHVGCLGADLSAEESGTVLGRVDNECPVSAKKPLARVAQIWNDVMSAGGGWVLKTALCALILSVVWLMWFLSSPRKRVKNEGQDGYHRVLGRRKHRVRKDMTEASPLLF